jgi:2-polyprenyl-3-methyl-5-hydroxy-6-metoxy-1,4-benzoquinol methylase
MTTSDLVERLFGATIGALELFSIHLGAKLGLYEVLADGGPLTPVELAERAGIAERYAREWLEQQAVAGLLEEDGGRFRLPDEHVPVLAVPESLDHVAPFGALLAGIGGVLDEVAEAYRTGGGVPYAHYGTDFRHGQGAINRPAFTHELPGSWVPAMPDVRERLEAGGRAADVGCGQGWSAIALARAYPATRVDGFDSDPASLEDARQAAEAAGVADRVRFLDADATSLADAGPYDLVVVLEALHDFAQPVESLAAMRAALADGGSVMVADERVAETFTAPGDEVERMMYGWSVTHCLPTQLAEQPSAATGTVMRDATLRRYAAEGGFTQVDDLPIENDLFRFWRLRG